MYCWHCGHKNQDDNKFCGECGKKQLRPADVADDTSAGPSSLGGRETIDPKAVIPRSPANESGKQPLSQKILVTDPLVEYAPPKRINRTLARRASDKLPASVTPEVSRSAPEPIPSDFGLHPIQVEPPSNSKVAETPPVHETRVVSNPIINEPGAVRESIAAKPISPAPPAASKRPANRISGPSFLGLSNEPSSDSSYLLDEEDADASTSSSWPGVLALTLLIVFGVLLVKQWSSIEYFATTYAQKAGLTSGPKTGNNGNDAIHHPPAAASASGAGISSTESAADNDQKNTEKKQLAGNKGDTSRAQSSPVDNLQKPENDDVDNRKSSNAREADKRSDAADVSTNTSKPSPAHDTENAEAKKSYDNSQIQLAEKYLYGRGVTQDCGRAMNLLQSSASQQNPNAQIKLGALYATGQCVQQDRAQAYGWYSKAKRLEPGNTWLDYSLNSLWASMSDDERRRAQSL